MALKHVGRFKTNGRKVAVVFRTLPDDPESALVVQTENLGYSEHDILMRMLESNTGQSAEELADAMQRTTLDDGSIMLANFHVNGKLTKVSTKDIEMTPTTSDTIGLDELNKIIAEQKGVTIADLALKDPNEPAPGTTITEAGSVSEMPKSTLADDNVVAEAKAANLEAPTDGVITDEQLAAKYRSDADRLYKEAKALRAQAEELVPTTKKSKSAKATA